jgi:hypothetical protein
MRNAGTDLQPGGGARQELQARAAVLDNIIQSDKVAADDL